MQRHGATRYASQHRTTSISVTDATGGASAHASCPRPPFRANAQLHHRSPQSSSQRSPSSHSSLCTEYCSRRCVGARMPLSKKRYPRAYMHALPDPALDESSRNSLQPSESVASCVFVIIVCPAMGRARIVPTWSPACASVG